jgi:sensor histidine kinase YesM
MNIKTKLFIFIPLLVILLNLVSFFIYQNGRTVEDSYNLMIKRIFLYKQISGETLENLRLLNQHMINLNEDSLNALNQHQELLRSLNNELAKRESVESNYLVTENYMNMINTFIEQEEDVLYYIDNKNLDKYAFHYNEAEKIAGYIKEQGENLVDLELNYYNPYYEEILVKSEKMNEIGVSLFIITTLLSIVFAIWLSRSITIPINRLVDTARKISKGNLEIEAPMAKMSGEIGILFQTFNHMLSNIRTLISTNMEMLEKDRMVKELELKALQSQINPHFLFNTLNIVSRLALIEGADQTSELTVSVSNLLRYNLRKLDEPVTLRDEVNNSMEYISIQKTRFADRVSFVTEIDEEALDQPVPCLTLQPILENAFVHGIEGMEGGGLIKIVIKRVAEQVHIEISDNGVGMSKEKQIALLDKELDTIPKSLKGHSTGIGTKNVFKRLDLFYKQDVFIDIKSSLNEGTTVIIHLPYQNYEYTSQSLGSPFIVGFS